MNEFSNESLDGIFGDGRAERIGNARFVECTFHDYTLSYPNSIDERTVVHDVELIRCVEQSGYFGPAILENVYVEDLKTTDLFILCGTMFNQVTIKGDCGRIKLNECADILGSEEFNSAFTKFRNEYYKTIDWALDLRESRFRYAEFHGVPAKLVRRDPETQIVITRKTILEADNWRDELDDRDLETFIDFFLWSECDDEVLVAPMLASKKERDLALTGFEKLRRLGYALPD